MHVRHQEGRRKTGQEPEFTRESAYIAHKYIVSYHKNIVSQTGAMGDLDEGTGDSPEDYGMLHTELGLASTVRTTDAAGQYQRLYKIRPPVEDKHRGKGGEALEFQLLDVDYMKLPYQRPGSATATNYATHAGGFTIDAFGTTAEGHSVCFLRATQRC